MTGMGVPFDNLAVQRVVAVSQNWAAEHWVSSVHPPVMLTTCRPVGPPVVLLTTKASVFVPVWNGLPPGIVKFATAPHAGVGSWATCVPFSRRTHESSQAHLPVIASDVGLTAGS